MIRDERYQPDMADILIHPLHPPKIKKFSTKTKKIGDMKIRISLMGGPGPPGHHHGHHLKMAWLQSVARDP